MSIIIMAWSMVAALALSMAAIQLLMWVRHRKEPELVLASAMSLAAAACAMLEMWLAKTNSIVLAQELIYWANFVIFILLMAMVWFVHLHLGHDRKWLLYIITFLWAVCIVVNAVMPGNLTFSFLVTIKENTTAWGEIWYQPIGEANAFRALSEIASLLIVIFVADAMIAALRAGARRRALLVGCPILFFIVIGGVHTPLVDNHLVQTPYMVSWAFVAIALSMGFALVDQASRAAELRISVASNNLRWQTLLNNVGLGIVGLSCDGNITYVNPFFKSLIGTLGVPPKGQRFIDLFPHELQDEIAERIDKANVLGSERDFEFPLNLGDEGVTIVRLGVFELGGENEAMGGYLVVCEDITSLKNTEAQLRRSERTLDQFNRASFLAEVGSGLAHEINQPLAAILANAQAGVRMIEQEAPKSGELSEILDDIVYDSQRAGQIVKSIRRMFEEKELKRDQTSIAKLLDELKQIVTGELSESGIRLRINIQQVLPDLYVGKVELQQVVMNLIVNAIRELKSSETANPEILLRAMTVGKCLRIEVVDNGRGVEQTALPRIFDTFYSTSKGGLGVGLAISRRIVESYDGTIECNSVAGQGTTFRVSLPIMDCKLDEHEQYERKAS